MKDKKKIKQIIKRLQERPLLDLYVRIPFVWLRTHILSESSEMYTKEYIWLQVRIYKWEVKFRLYQTGIRIHEKGETK